MPSRAVMAECDRIRLQAVEEGDELTLFGLGNPALMALDADGVARWVANAVPDISAPDMIDGTPLG